MQPSVTMVPLALFPICHGQVEPRPNLDSSAVFITSYLTWCGAGCGQAPALLCGDLLSLPRGQEGEWTLMKQIRVGRRQRI